MNALPGTVSINLSLLASPDLTDAGIGICLSEFKSPLAFGFIGQLDAAVEHKSLYMAMVQGKA